ncbi:acyl carrier protein [Kitasatospora viridis]|uniref:Acyl carrier protein n=2 Tax=Kitasatospora viridis TaxID=281105 RepID=A0A561UHU3_9ACTN|nr:acyl carrier protein [Kitasatospora viridis]
MLDRIQDLLREVLAARGLPADGLTAESNLFVDFGLDSIALLEFLVELEARLGVAVDFESLEYEDLVSLTSLEQALQRA